MGALMVQTVVAFEGCTVQAEGLGALLIHVQTSIVYIYMCIIKEIRFHIYLYVYIYTWPRALFGLGV